jgi:hypothetical protein
MPLTCSTNDDINAKRRARRAELLRHRERLLLHKIQQNRKNYPDLFKIIDSTPFQHWYVICTGKPWPTILEADVEDVALKLNAMQLVYGPIPDE